MSGGKLVKKARMTDRKRAANRANAAKSTGPRTEQGKRRSSLNSLKHGLHARSFREAMEALGEDPREYDRLHRDFIVSFDPATPFEAALVEDLAMLWWRKARAERGQAGVQVSQTERLQVERLRELAEVNREGIEEPQEQILEVGLRRLKDSTGKFQEAASFLEMLLGQVERGKDAPDAKMIFRALYGKNPTWRGSLIVNLFEDLSAGEQGESGADDREDDDSSPQSLRAMLVHLLLEEISEVMGEQELFLRSHLEISQAARDATLAPTDSRWTWMLRQENSFERQIDRKLKQLRSLQSLDGWGGRLRSAYQHASRRPGAPRRGRAPAAVCSQVSTAQFRVANKKDVKNAQTKPRSSAKQKTGPAKRTQNELPSNPQRTRPKGDRTWNGAAPGAMILTGKAKAEKRPANPQNRPAGLTPSRLSVTNHEGP